MRTKIAAANSIAAVHSAHNCNGQWLIKKGRCSLAVFIIKILISVNSVNLMIIHYIGFCPRVKFGITLVKNGRRLTKGRYNVGYNEVTSR